MQRGGVAPSRQPELHDLFEKWVRCRLDDVYLSHDALVVMVYFTESGRFQRPYVSTCLVAVIVSTRLVVLENE